MRKYIVPVLVLLLVATVFLASGQSERIADNYPFEKALELSRILDRQLVFSFVSAECPHCQEFKDEILSDSEVRDTLNNHFVLSLVTVDETFKIELPGQGEVTNMQMASGLDVKGTPTTYVFYPPDPDLFREGGAITQFPGTPPDPESMVDFLERIVTESFKKEEKTEGGTYYNYRPKIKEISKKDFNTLEETSIGFPVVTEKLSMTSLPEGRELILNFAGESLREYSERVISETDAKKVYLVKR